MLRGIPVWRLEVIFGCAKVERLFHTSARTEAENRLSAQVYLLVSVSHPVPRRKEWERQRAEGRTRGSGEEERMRNCG